MPWYLLIGTFYHEKPFVNFQMDLLRKTHKIQKNCQWKPPRAGFKKSTETPAVVVNKPGERGLRFCKPWCLCFFCSRNCEPFFWKRGILPWLEYSGQRRWKPCREILPQIFWQKAKTLLFQETIGKIREEFCPGGSTLQILKIGNR